MTVKEGLRRLRVASTCQQWGTQHPEFFEISRPLETQVLRLPAARYAQDDKVGVTAFILSPAQSKLSPLSPCSPTLHTPSPARNQRQFRRRPGCIPSCL